MICELFQNGPLFPAELRMNSCGAKLNPQICPSNPDLVAYVCNSDIWVSHTLTGNSLVFGLTLLLFYDKKYCITWRW